MKKQLPIFGLLAVIACCNGFSQTQKITIQLPRLSVEQKWKTAEGNLVYFIVSGISYAKSKGETAEDFGTWAGNIGCPYWKTIDSLTPAKFVQEISNNKQQFKDFQMEIIAASSLVVKGKMKGYGNKILSFFDTGGVTEEDYVHFFNNKWMAIAKCVGLNYKQETIGEWVYFSVSKLP
jgi:hypothetical protein